ncbi:hypothetical protein [Mucilaginibacter sp. L196]|uniref:hypothetical protein n=1 Tax=Mucilaginibacter sp. L196 TaxID=1641870 RepID=UPI00131CB018|nr:hypothetical protein [Mucilaginibacter sp. L196]
MPRKRYLKPSFFKNEDLAELSPLIRLFFQGLWCWADREGRLEDRPKRLKSELMPYDNLNIETALNKLVSKNFVVRYKTQINGEQVAAIQIINFKKHQDVHVNEQQSTIPAPVLHSTSTVQEPCENGGSTPLNLELRTSTLDLEDIDVNTRTAKIEEADRDKTGNIAFPEHTHLSEKEKSSAQKEKKPVPSLEEAIVQVSKAANWWNVIRFHLSAELISRNPDTKWDNMPEEDKKPLYDQREKLFEKFYATKKDNYLIRMPPWKEIAQNFYYWVPSELNREKLQQLNNHVISKTKHTGSNIAKPNAANGRIERNSSVENLAQKSEDFLHKYFDEEHN